ncbi:substrate-binding domain-containing protein [Domibacillus sp. A3M-37]|nr:substrate-binding domain-containing protein [Domibacillus sp. A3M-37]
MAIGAIQAAEEAGVLNEMMFAGIDGTPDALNYIQQGKLAVTIYQDAKGQGQEGIEAALRLVKGERTTR